MTRVYGSMPPKGSTWELGKTAPSIKFVHEAEVALPSCDATDADRLRRQIARVKDGSVVLKDWLTPEQFLRRQKRKRN